MSAKKLNLKKEVLAELTSEELTRVAGGSHDCNTMPVNLCLSIEVCEASHHPRCLIPTQPPSCNI